LRGRWRVIHATVIVRNAISARPG